MYILAIETTGPQCSVAVIREDGTVTELASKPGMNHLQNLMPLVSEILERSGLKLNDAAACAVSRGPGSFTGIRIGVSTARALAQASGMPAIAVPTLETFAYMNDADECLIAPMLDARRSQVYGGAYFRRNGEVIEAVKGGAYSIGEFLGLVGEACDSFGLSEIVFMGDGCVNYGDAASQYCADINIPCTLDGSCQRASACAQLALKMFRKGELVQYGELMPDYMRKAEAERKLEEKLAGDRENG